MEDYDSGTLLPHQFYLCKVQSFTFNHAFLNFINCNAIFSISHLRF